MTKAHLLTVLVVCISLLVTVHPAFGLRCDGKLIDRGDTKAQVREACGEPTCIRPPGTLFTEKAGIYWPMAADEEWVYNLGPRQFIRFLRFYQGKVVHIQYGGYGWTDERECEDIPDE
jgi:hypothetical protein